MKKLMIFLALMFAFAVISEAQVATVNFSKGQTYYEYQTDVTLTNTTAKYFVFKCPQDYYTAQAYAVDMDSTSGDHTNVAVVLAGRVSDVVDWTTISTTNWKGISNAGVDCAGNDTCMVVLNATENAYREFRLTFTGTGTGVTTINNVEFKLYYGLP